MNTGGIEKLEIFKFLSNFNILLASTTSSSEPGEKEKKQFHPFSFFFLIKRKNFLVPSFQYSLTVINEVGVHF